MNQRLAAVLTCIVYASASSVALADAEWEVGVSTENREKANEIFAEGNGLFAQQAHQAALEKYKQAIALWDHPLIRFNMAVTLVRLDRILEAADDIDSALRFGAAPYTPEHYQQALDYQRLIQKQVGTIEASCTQDGVQLLLDGKPWFQCPGTKKQRVLAGEHVLVGEKQDFATESRRLVVAGNATKSAKVALRSFESVVKLEYPSPRWIPYSVLGTGAAIGLGGLAFWFAGRGQMDKFEADFATTCPTGCPADLKMQAFLADERDSAELKGKIGIAMMISGGAVAAGGAVWAILNRPKRVLPTMEVAPTSGGLAASVRVRF